MSAYRENVARNQAWMGTRVEEWSAEESDYPSAPTLFRSSPGCVVCEWCGKSGIKDTFPVANHAKRLSLQVGSECVRQISGGASGAELRKAEEWAANRAFLARFERMPAEILRECSHTYDAGYGRRERRWHSREAYELYREILRLCGSTVAEK